MLFAFSHGKAERMKTGGESSNGEGFLSRMALNDNKAGMEGLDRDKINKIIMETSKVASNNLNINYSYAARNAETH